MSELPLNIPALSSIWSERLGLTTVVLLFPGYLLYHFAIGTGLIPPILGGFFAITSIALFPLLIAMLVRDVAANLVTTYQWCVLLFIGYCMAWALVHAIVGNDYQRAHVSDSISDLLLLTVITLGARALNVGSVWVKRTLVGLWGVVACVVLLSVDQNLTIGLLIDRSDDESVMGGYQGIARSVLVTSLVLIAILRGMTLVLVILVTLGVLFTIGARSEFAGFVIVIAWMMPLWFREKKRIVFGIAIPLTLIVPLVLSGAIPQTSRILELFDLSQSTSYVARGDASETALRTIVDRPILGDFGSDVGGNYAHNALSAWVSYGIVGFFFYVSLILVPFTDTFRRIVFEVRDVDTLMKTTFCFSVYTLAMIISAKSVSDPVAGFCWGLYAAMTLRDRLSSSGTLNNELHG